MLAQPAGELTLDRRWLCSICGRVRREQKGPRRPSVLHSGRGGRDSLVTTSRKP